jgi:MYXO-CTERM domain-containing protein
MEWIVPALALASVALVLVLRRRRPGCPRCDR